MFYRETQDAVPDKNGNRLWRPEVVRTKKVVDARELAKVMSTATTLTVTEIMGVLLILPEFMNLSLREGHTVRLDGLGTFTLYGRSKGKGVETVEEVKPSQFTNITCRFTPEYTVAPNGNRTRALLDNIEFIHVDRLAKKPGNNSGNNNDDDGYEQDPNA